MQQSVVKILDCLNNTKNCARAARISTTKGNSLDIYMKHKAPEDDSKLISKVLKSGHKSFLEHAVFTIAFCNVSALVEQFFIEFRLISFTIKSRRYVDFGNMGYYIPSFLDSSDKEKYVNHMNYLFDEYNLLIEKGIPKEDARFILPYSFFSNFYCTVNARELLHIINEIRTGRGARIDELQDIAKQLIDQLSVHMPVILDELKDNSTRSLDDNLGHEVVDTTSATTPIDNNPDVRLISSTRHQLTNLIFSYAINNNTAMYSVDEILHDEKMSNDIVKHLANKIRARELEQLNYTYYVSNITLAGITHMVRHRIQSIVIPPVHDVNIHRYLTPQTVESDTQLCQKYHQIFDVNAKIYSEMLTKGYNPVQLSYFALSGNTFNILTTMNARELRLFFSIRACQRAQWEIRDIAIKMLKLAQDELPLLFNSFGPSCFLKGICPEGALSCGVPHAIKNKFASLNKISTN